MDQLIEGIIVIGSVGLTGLFCFHLRKHSGFGEWFKKAFLETVIKSLKQPAQDENQTREH
jgi:hypothetical protein